LAVVGGAVYEWGGYSNGITYVWLWPPLVRADLPIGDKSVHAGYDHACVMYEDGVRCWGETANGELGFRGGITQSATTIGGITRPTAIAIGRDHTCVIDGGIVKCWGRNHRGQLGIGSTMDSLVPVPVALP
jgi:alpha-tubulin suppressor-like RCC1 family protein